MASEWPAVYDENYLPPPDQVYWFPDLECMDPSDRDKIILWKLKRQLAYAYERSPFYRRKWGEARISPSDISSLDEFRRIPIVTKAEVREDQAKNPPFGSYLCIPPEQVCHIHGTSGTTGKPTAFGFSAADWRRIANSLARVMWGFGLRPSDTVFIGSFFSLYMGSWGALIGAERLGARVIPFGAGLPGQTLMSFRWILDLQPTAFYGTPSYALYLAERARQEGYDPAGDFNFRIMFFSGEPGAGISATKREIEETFGATCIDTGSMAEMTPWMTNGECSHRTGMHLWQDIVYAEVLDPETQEPVPPGGEGVIVYTHLERDSHPMIRYWSGDITTWTDEPCPCGRTYPRLPKGLYGRIDDMLIIRGENVYPSAVEEALRQLPEFGGEYRIIVTRARELDEFAVQAEYSNDIHAAEPSEADLTRIRETMVERIRSVVGVRPRVELVAPGTLERTQFKARRVIDRR